MRPEKALLQLSRGCLFKSFPSIYNIIIFKAKSDRQIKVYVYLKKCRPWYFLYDNVENKKMWKIQNQRYVANFLNKNLKKHFDFINKFSINEYDRFKNVFLSIKWAIPQLFITVTRGHSKVRKNALQIGSSMHGIACLTAWGDCINILAISIQPHPLDKMAALVQTLVSGAFSWKKMCVFWLKISLKFVHRGTIDSALV